jgi:hypothetical protein
MAWTVPQLLKRVQLIEPGVRSTTGALRALISLPRRDAEFGKAFAESGFLSCDEAIARVRWRHDVAEMQAKLRSASGAQALAHCQALLARDGLKQPLDWDAVLADLATLAAWFPELHTVRQLEQLYTRLHSLHIQAVRVARCCLDGGAARHAASPRG